MPIYEYNCPKCGTIEQMQNIEDAPLAECPVCHEKIERILSVTNPIFHGTGFYETDYKKGSEYNLNKTKKEEG